MTTLMRFLLVAAAFSVAVARVSWKNSELFDQFDVQGAQSIRFTVCSRGCYVFASLPVERSGCEEQVLINDHSLSLVASLANSSTGEKGYVELSGNQSNTITNYNTEGRSCPFAIFAVSKRIGNNDLPAPSLIDPRLKDRGEKWLQLTFFSYDPYTIDHLEINEKDSVATLYHTGYDAINPFDHAYCHAILSGPKSDRILFPIYSPLLTILVSSEQPFNYSTTMGIADRVVIDGVMETIVASPGYIGCRKAGVFRYDIPQPPVNVHFVSSSDPPRYTMVPIHANLHVSEDNSIVMGGGKRIWGDTRYGSPLSDSYTFCGGFNIEWMGTYEWSTFAFSMKFSPKNSGHACPHAFNR